MHVVKINKTKIGEKDISIKKIEEYNTWKHVL